MLLNEGIVEGIWEGIKMKLKHYKNLTWILLRIKNVTYILDYKNMYIKVFNWSR